MSRRTYSVICLAWHGVGPEVMAAASRALAATCRLHGMLVEERHVPFGADALTRFGRPFPHSSRRAVVAADAVLVASKSGHALVALEEDLDFHATVVSVRFDHGNITLFSPLGPDGWAWTLERASASARASRGRITLVGVDPRWADEADELEAYGDGLEVERLDAQEAVRALVFDPERFDVVVCPPELTRTAPDLAAGLRSRRTTAWGRLAPEGPSVFGVSDDAADELAGHGVADPSSMLLAAALMLGEGLGERSAAATLTNAVGRAGPTGMLLPSTRDRADVVVAQLPLALANAEFYREAV
ncbi:MAG TPA: hypothetical protein VEH52_11940 [Gaiellaceae bacterium]|nr:hypothetical protein [Gaiellaceae bacterium]